MYKLIKTLLIYNITYSCAKNALKFTKTQQLWFWFVIETFSYIQNKIKTKYLVIQCTAVVATALKNSLVPNHIISEHLRNKVV